jgi:hypothetical protein
MDNFESYATTSGFEAAWGHAGASLLTDYAGRGNALDLTQNLSYASPDIDLSSMVREFIFSTHIRFADTNQNHTIIEIQNSNGRDFRLMKYPTGKLHAIKGNAGVLQTSSQNLYADKWYHIEWRCKHSTTEGISIAKVNGELAFSGTGLNTVNFGGEDILSIRIAENSALLSHIIVSDVVFMDLSGTVNNDFIGDYKIENLIPNGNGKVSNFSGSDGNSTDNFALVSGFLDNDRTYVQSSGVGDQDLYACSNMPIAPIEIYGISVNQVSKKTDAGSRTSQSIIRTGGTNYTGISNALTETYKSFSAIFEENPNTTSNWTLTEIDSLEIGNKVES